MPKLKQPATLGRLAIQALWRAISQKAVEAIASGIYININDLHEYLYGELPEELSLETAAHMLAELPKTLEDEEVYFNNETKQNILLGIIYHGIRVLDLSRAPWYTLRTLSSNKQTFKELRGLIFPDELYPCVEETLCTGLSSLNHLVHFRMRSNCTDDMIQTIASCCHATIQHINVNYSEQVSNAILKILLECRKLRHILISGTSVTAEGLVQFLKEKKSDDAAEGFLGLGFGQVFGWEVTSTVLTETALCCPMLKQLEIDGLRGNMEALVGLTKLEELIAHSCNFGDCNFRGFLRVKGSDITSLELDLTESIDIPFIMKHCVNIKNLVLNGGVLDTPLGKLSAYHTLQTLKLSWGSSSSRIIEAMLYACVNVTSLDLYTYAEDISDDLILRVLSRNPLQKLTSFTVYSHKLTMKSLNAIVEHCPLLEEVEYFEYDDITAEEVKLLRQKIEKKNQDLKIYFTEEE